MQAGRVCAGGQRSHCVQDGVQCWLAQPGRACRPFAEGADTLCGGGLPPPPRDLTAGWFEAALRSSAWSI